jgi:hypothetical protein
MGFAAGFQAGSQVVERALQRRKEEELQKGLAKAYAQPESFSDYTPAQQQQIQGLQASGAYDVEAVPSAEGQAPTLRYVPRQGLDLQGDMPGGPIEVTPQQVQRYGGQTVAGQFNPEVLQGLQMREAARVLGASGDPVRASQLQADALRIEREAKEAPLRFKGLEQQVALGAESVNRAQRENQAAVRMDTFNAWQAQNPTADYKAIANKTRELGMSVDEQFKVASNLTGLKESSLKNNELAIKEMVQGKSLDQLSQMHKDNELLDPGSHFEVLRSKNGQVTLQRVDSATGKAMGGPTFTGSEAEATRYLFQAATSPETIVDFTTNLEKTKAAIAASKATLTNALAQAGAASARVNLTKSQQKQLDDLNANREKALGYAEQFEELSDKDKVGEKGRSLTKLFNMFNAKAGGQTGLERMQPPEKPEKRITDAAVKDYAKELIGKPTGRMVNGKKEVFTAVTAPAAARKLLAGEGADERELPDYPQ